jgi:DNA-directed RNA polymerase subunit RPC12/RpoP
MSSDISYKCDSCSQPLCDRLFSKKGVSQLYVKITINLEDGDMNTYHYCKECGKKRIEALRIK